MEKISQEHKNILVQLLTLQEITETLQSMELGKAPKHDGFPTE